VLVLQKIKSAIQKGFDKEMAENKYKMNSRSALEFGEAAECRRGLMRGMGYSEAEMKRPLIGIVNSWNEYNPGHVHLDKLAQRVKQGVREAGGLPLEVMTTAICDGMCLKDPKYIEIPSRNSIADQVEITVEGNFFDAIVMLSTCDSIVPGHLMAAARLDIPTIIVTGGYMPLGQCRGKEVVHIHAQDKVGTAAAGKMDMDEYNDLIANSWGICGACTSMTTANSMCMIAEALGMTLPNNSSMSAVSSQIYHLAYQAGKQIMKLLEAGITARQVMTVEAIKNAIKLDMAVAGSSNLILHIPAIANEAGYDLPWWKYFDEASNDIPLMSHLCPGGPYSIKDFDLAGGTGVMLKELLPKLDGDVMTVTGHTLRENVQHMINYNPEVIRSLSTPVMNEPGLGVLYGNLAPEGAIIKIAAVPEGLFTFKGKARVFDSLQDGLNELRAGKIYAGDAIILRYMGLKGRFGTTAFTFQEELKGNKELYHSCAIITDGRFSGGTSGLSIGYVSPEAALKGPLALVNEGDEISIDLPNRSIHLHISDEEMAAREALFDWKFPENEYPRFLNLFAKNVGSMAKGGIWEV
jgi:dihydroxy-acid dehydratase